MQQDPLSTATGINTGEAQVFKPYENNFQTKIATVNQKKAQEQEEKRKSVYGKLSKINSAGIFPRDTKYFAKKQQELYDFTVQNVDKLLAGDPALTIEFNQRMANLETDIEQSKNAREFWESTTRQFMADPTKKRSGTLDYLAEFADESNMGNWQFDVTKVQENINLVEELDKTIRPLAQTKSQKGGSTVVDAMGNKVVSDIHSFTQQEAEDAIRSTLMNSPVLFDQAVYEFGKLSPEEQKKYGTPEGYVMKQFAPRYTFNDSKFTKDSSGSSDYSYGNGMARNNKFQFAYQQGEVKGTGKSGVGWDAGNTDEIRISTINEGENKPIFLKDPNNDVDRIEVIPISYRRGVDDKWELVGVQKKKDDSGATITETITLPADRVKADMKANYNFELDKFIQQSGLQSEKKSPEPRKNEPTPKKKISGF